MSIFGSLNKIESKLVDGVPAHILKYSHEKLEGIKKRLEENIKEREKRLIAHPGNTVLVKNIKEDKKYLKYVIKALAHPATKNNIHSSSDRDLLTLSETIAAIKKASLVLGVIRFGSTDDEIKISKVEAVDFLKRLDQNASPHDYELFGGRFGFVRGKNVHLG